MANARLKLLSGNNSKYIVCDSNVTAVANDKIIASKGGITVTLPSAPGFGTEVIVKNDGGSAVTVGRGGSDTIGNANGTSFSVGAGTCYKFVVMASGTAQKWKVEQLSGSFDSVQLKMGDAFVMATISPGVKTVIQQSANLK